MGHFLPCALAAALLAAGAPGQPWAGEAGDVILAPRGPWALEGRPVTWNLMREGPALPGFLPIGAGTLTLAEATDPADGKRVLQLTQRTDAGERRIGPFPLSAGDPVAVFFLESTVRDMAALTGGNPDYIRNRIKDAVFRGGSVAHAEGRTVATVRPFAADPARGRMGAFAGLTLRVEAGAGPAAPLRELVAETADPVAPAALRGMAGRPVAPARYRNALVLR